MLPLVLFVIINHIFGWWFDMPDDPCSPIFQVPRRPQAEICFLHIPVAQKIFIGWSIIKTYLIDGSNYEKKKPCWWLKHRQKYLKAWCLKPLKHQRSLPETSRAKNCLEQVLADALSINSSVRSLCLEGAELGDFGIQVLPPLPGEPWGLVVFHPILGVNPWVKAWEKAKEKGRSLG